MAGSEGKLEGFEEGSVGGPRVPSIVSHCLDHLRRYGLRTLGLFRVGTSKKRVRQVRKIFKVAVAVCCYFMVLNLIDFIFS